MIRHPIIALTFTALVAACSPIQQPDLSTGEQIMDRQGQVVGTADPADVTEALNGGEQADVYRDGELVGHFGPDGFEPLNP